MSPPIPAVFRRRFLFAQGAEHYRKSMGSGEDAIICIELRLLFQYVGGHVDNLRAALCACCTSRFADRGRWWCWFWFRCDIWHQSLQLLTADLPSTTWGGGYNLCCMSFSLVIFATLPLLLSPPWSHSYAASRSGARNWKVLIIQKMQKMYLHLFPYEKVLMTTAWHHAHFIEKTTRIFRSMKTEKQVS